MSHLLLYPMLVAEGRMREPWLTASPVIYLPKPSEKVPELCSSENITNINEANACYDIQQIFNSEYQK